MRKQAIKEYTQHTIIILHLNHSFPCWMHTIKHIKESEYYQHECNTSKQYIITIKLLVKFMEGSQL